MRRLLRLAAVLSVSLPLAGALAATAWAVPAERRGGYRAKFLKTWSGAVCRLLGIRVEVAGKLPEGGPWLAVSNHLGYADIPVLGSVLPGAFVSKTEVARWPLVGFLANAAGTIYVNRENRADAGKFVEEVRRRIDAGGNVLLFPEGTSSRGTEVLPFKTAPFAAVAGVPGRTVLPVRVDLAEIEGNPAVGPSRDAVCWHGDAEFAPHLFRMLALRSIRYRISIGTPILCGDLDRKQIALEARERVVSLGQAPPRPGAQPDWMFLWFHPVP